VPGVDIPAGGIARAAVERVYEAGGVCYRVLVLPIYAASDDPVGELHLATALSDEYAESLSALTRTQTVVLVGGRLVASTLSPGTRESMAQRLRRGAPRGDRLEAGRTTWAVARLKVVDDASIFAVDPLDRAQMAAWREVAFVLGPVGLGALGLGALASLWLARTLSRPIDSLSHTLAEMASSRRFDVRLPRPGTSRELDALTDTFNDLMRSLATAEAETRAAYVGTIRGLAAALDARDPYTAGHSERVSALAVSIGRQMTLPDRDVDVLRLGALLHDIGKIGVNDHILRKPGPLTVEEFEAIKQHTRLGSRILRSVPFLAPHIPIVELHHERPDGQGYPHGLAGDEVPLLARIVKVADAFDAMTSARAYRPARPASDALAELWRHAGSQFDAEVVEAFATVWPAVGTVGDPVVSVPPRALYVVETGSRFRAPRTPA
jgi:putative nucleotidyltransferase with HDIG domain